MTRWFDVLKAFALFGLVAASVLLSAQLWLDPGWSAQAPAYRTPYVVGRSRSDVAWTGLIRPHGLILYLPGGDRAWAQPGDEPYDVLALELPRLLLQAQTGGWQAVDDAALQEWLAEPPAVAAEMVLPAALPLDAWRELWQGLVDAAAPAPAEAGAAPAETDAGAARAGDAAQKPAIQAASVPHERINRLGIAFSGERAWLLLRHDRGYRAAEIAADQPVAVRQRLLQAQALLELADTLPLAALIPVTEAALELRGGLHDVALPPEPPIVQSVPSDVNWDQLARVFFTDLSLVRQVLTESVRIYTDGSVSLHARPVEGYVRFQDGAAIQAFQPVLQQAPGGEPQAAQSLADALQAAVEFGNVHGGWPVGAYLAAVEPLAPGLPLSAGARLIFHEREQQLPLLAEPLAQADVAGGRVLRWERRFREDALEETIAFPVRPLREAIAALAAAGAERLPQGPVLEAHLVYVDHGEGFFRPAWLLRFPDAHVWVDAWNPAITGRSDGTGG